MLYPKELVDKYGAKAGILMYVKEHLPHIPQTKFVTKTPENSIDSILKKAESENIGWPRMIRSSAVEELYGFEGDFLTEEVDSFENGNREIRWNPHNHGPYSTKERHEKWIQDTIQRVEESPQAYQEESEHKLPDKINVIIAEKYKSDIKGVMIGHPNQEDTLLFALTDVTNKNDPSHSLYQYKNKSIKYLEEFAFYMKESNITKDLLIKMAEYYKQITGLPELDKNYSYQLEFGIDPTLKLEDKLCLFQVRPYRKIEYANFKLEKQTDRAHIVIGITNPEGIDVKVEEDVWERHIYGKKINKEKHPAVFSGFLREVCATSHIPNYQACLLSYSNGLFAHEDTKAIRNSKVAGLFADSPHVFARQGDWLNIKSDGRTIAIKKIKKPKKYLD